MRARGASLTLVATLAGCTPFDGSTDTRPSTDAGSPTNADAAVPDGGSTNATDAGDGGSAPSTYSAVVLADGPLFYYRLEEGPGDFALSQGPGPNANIIGTPQLGVPGRVGQAFNFSGGGNLLVPRNDIDVDFPENAPFTAEAWMYLDNTDFGHVFTRSTRAEDKSRQAWGVFVQSGVVTFERVIDDDGNVATATISTGGWHHLVAVYGEGKLHLYVDAVLAGTATDPRLAKAKDLGLVIGARDNAVNQSSFPGKLDEVAVYDHALTADRIKAHYKAVP